MAACLNGGGARGFDIVWNAMLILDSESAVCSRWAFQLGCGQMLPLQITPGGSVRGLGETLSARHRTCFHVWQKEWNTMHRRGVLSEALTDGDCL